MIKFRRRLLSNRTALRCTLAMTLLLSVLIETEQTGTKCICSEDSEMLYGEIHSLKKEISDLSSTKEFVENFRKNLRDEIANIVNELIKENSGLSLPLVQKCADTDDSAIPKLSEETKEIAKNVSHLHVKLERIENKTSQNAEDIKTEKAVLNFLQLDMKQALIGVQDGIVSSMEDMNKTIYEDHLQKLYYKVDGVAYKNETSVLEQRLRQLETESKEHISNTVKISDTIMKLEPDTFRKADAEVLENKMTNLSSKVENLNTSITVELSPRITKLEELSPKITKLEELSPRITKLEELSPRITKLEKLSPRITKLEELSPRMMKLEADAFRKNDAKELNDKMADISLTVKQMADGLKNLEEKLKNLETSVTADILARLTKLESETFKINDANVLETKVIDSTEHFQKGLSDVKSDVQNLKSIQQKLENYTTAWNKSVEDIKSQIVELENKTSTCAVDGIKGSDAATDCEDLLKKGITRSGVYPVRPRSSSLSHPISVYCDMDTDGGGWTVLQRRGDFGHGKDYFFRDWKSYKEGFGNLDQDFWIGNDIMHTITNQSLYSIRFDLGDFQGNRAYAVYDKFRIEDENNAYKLHVSGYHGNAGDSFSRHSNMMFTTKDRDNDDTRSINCAIDRKGAWWFYYCTTCHLNGEYYKGQKDSEGIVWSAWKGMESLATTEMKIRKSRLTEKKV